MTSSSEDKLLTIAEAAERVSVSVATIRRMLTAGTLTRRQPAGMRVIRISSAELDAVFLPKKSEDGDTRA